MMTKFAILLAASLLISGCIDQIDTDDVKNSVVNSTEELKQYAENVSIPDPCIKIEGNVSCASDINISVKIDS